MVALISGERRLALIDKTSIKLILSSEKCSRPSFWTSATTYKLTKLFPYWENVQVTWKFQQLDFSHVRQKFGEMVGVRPSGDVVSLADEDERLRRHLRQVVGRRRWGPVQLEVLRNKKQGLEPGDSWVQC